MITRPFVNGIIAVAGSLGFYFGVIGLVSGWNFAWAQFSLSWYWIVGLSIGFGVQVFLFSYLRALHRERMSGVVVATSGAVSGSVMVACCAHYLVTVLPIVGVSAFAAVVGQYQHELFAVGAVSAIGGIAYMLTQLIKTKRKTAA